MLNSNKFMRVLLHIPAGLMSLFLIMTTAIAQPLQQLEKDSTDTKRGPYTIVVTAGGGLSYYASHLGVPQTITEPRLNKLGTPASLRVMWYPDHRLRIGLESGWTTMYRYRGRVAGETARMYVSAIPVLLVFSMPLAWLRGTDRSLTRRLSVTAGTGLYINYSHLDYAGKVTAYTNSPGWMAAASYTYPIGRRFRIAGEVKWFDAVAVQNAAFTAELQLVWRPYSW
ncbi:hypothetical protein Slin_5305 [Spirosoma linguale DSM 74]|uniref:Outer membrane protein beta-barrel domain-containing protein n=2 Tax=Spirosoma TaxID=107 RepID=D2QET0_SPILD|nr:hypothetical protein Slin_5305 [Spirosoma linguale DSM 74]